MILVLLFSFAFPDVPVSAPSFMSAAGWKRDLAIASNGESYFAAWSDSRMDGAVFATRLSADGRPLDPTGICIRGGDAAYRPRVTWTGRNWLVINELSRISGAWVSTIDPDGHIAGPRLLLDYPDFGRQPVASNGSTTVVVNAGLSGLEIVVLDDAGRTIASYIALPNNPSFSRLNPWIVSNGSGYFVGWLAAGGGTRFAIEGVRLDANGNLIDSNPIQVFTSTTVPDFPRIYSDGRDYLVVSGERVRRIGSDGTLGDEVQQPVSSFLIWRGDHYAMFSGNGMQYAVRALDRNGNSLGGMRIFDAKIDLHGSETAAASNGDNLVLAWIQYKKGSAIAYGDVAATSVDLLTYEASPPSILSFSAPPQSARAIAAGNDGFAIAWEEQSSNDPSFDSYVARVDALGNPISVKRLLHLEGVSTRGPRIAWNGSTYDVAFLAGDAIFTNRIGVEEEAHAIVAAGHATDLDLASNGDVTLLVWCEAGTGFIKGIRLRNGLPLDTVPLTISDEKLLRQPRVAWNGEAFVVVWESSQEIRAVRVTPELIPLEIAPIIVTGFGSNASSPAIASSGSDVLIAYSRVGIIEARLMTKDSTLSVPVQTEESWRRIEDQPSVSWDNGSYLLNWREYDYLSETHEIYGARVLRKGKLLPPTLLRGAAQNPLTAAANGRTLVLYDRLANEPPYGGVFRSFLQLLAPPRVRATRR